MRNNKTFLLAALIAASLGVAVPAGQADAATSATASGQTTFKVRLDPVVVLDYYKEIDLSINATALQTLAGTPAAQAGTAISATASGTTLTTDAAITPGSIDLSKISLTINNAWAIRSIVTPGSGTTSVQIGLNGTAGQSATLIGATDTSSKIILTGPATSVLPLTAGTGFGAPVKGDVKMNLDLSAAKSADTYGGATIYITATST